MTIEFEGLLEDGSWVVRDDDPGNDTYFDRSRVGWHWGSAHTDGGAYRDVTGAEITIDPVRFDGIDEWQVLDGDGSAVAEFSKSDSVTVTVSEGEPEGFDELADQKLQLAQRVTDASLTIDDVAIVQGALDTLDGNLSAGAVSEENALEAVRRMKLAENVSETALVTPGPVDVITPENPRTLVGADRDQSYDLVNRFTDLFIELCEIVAVLGGAIAGGAAAVVGGAAVAAVNELYAAVKGLLGDYLVSRRLDRRPLRQ